MMKIAISVKGSRARVALLDGDQLTEYAIWDFEKAGDIGDLFSGRVTAKIPAMAGSFVDLGEMNAFLPDTASVKGLVEGDYVAAEIIRCAQGGKGPRIVTHEQEVPHKSGLIRQGCGPLQDLVKRYSRAPIIIDDHRLIVVLSNRAKQAGTPSLADRLCYKAATFDAVLEDEIATLAEPNVRLARGSRMHINPTPALTAIDIDAGSATADKLSQQTSQLALNLALMPAISRQIILRNLSGAILIDFAGLKKTARLKLLPALNLALQSDPLRPKCHGLSSLGFAEISRQRIRPPLYEFL